MQNSLPNIESALLSVAAALGATTDSLVTHNPGAKTFSTTSTAWQDTGVDITLPVKGTWIYVANFRHYFHGVANRYCAARLWNEDEGVVLGNSLRLIALNTMTAGYQNNTVYVVPITTTEDDQTIRLELKASGSMSTHKLLDDYNGGGIIMALRVAQKINT